MRALSSYLRLACIPLLLALSLEPLPADEPDAALAGLREQLAKPGVNLERLRQDVLVYHRQHIGTVQGVRAGVLLSELPSPLDHLDPAKIPPLERFDWQPKELVAVLAEHRGRHGAAVSSVLITPDGKHIASGGGSSLVRLWEPESMRLREVLGASGVAYSLACTPNSEILAAGCSDGTTRLWNLTLEKAKVISVIPVATNPVYSVAFTPGGKRLATASGDGLVRVWSQPWAPPPKDPVATLGGHTGAVLAVAYAPDGKTLVSGGQDGEIRVWSYAGDTVKEVAVLKDHEKAVQSLAFDPTAKEQPLLASAGADGKVRLWRFGTGKPKLLHTFETKHGPIYTVTFTPDGKTLAYGEGDYSVRLIDVFNRKERVALKGHALVVTSLSFGPKEAPIERSRRIVTGSSDWTVRLWEDVSRDKPTQKTVTVGHLSAVYTAAFAPGDRTLATGSEDRTVRLWDLTGAAGKQKSELPIGYQVYSLAYLPDGKRLATAGANANPQLWDIEAKKESQSFKGHGAAVNSLALSPDGKQLLTGSSDKTARLWETSSGKELRRFEDHVTPVIGVAMSPDGRRIATASGNYLYDDKNQIVVKDGRIQYIDCLVRLWDLPAGKGPDRRTGHGAFVYEVAFAPDSRALASGSADLTLRLWDPVGNREPHVQDVKGHLYSVAYSPDGRLMATVGSDAKVSVRDPASGKAIQEWEIRELIRRVAFASDSRHIAVTLHTGVVYVLRLRSLPLREQ
jgi:WD40 repeat protein